MFPQQMHILRAHQQWDCNLSTSSPILVILCFLDHSHLNRCEEVTSHCGSHLHLLTISDAEQLFIDVLAICMTSLEKHLFMSFAYF